MKRILSIVILIAFLTPFLAAEPEWSEPVHGIRARLSLECQKDSPFLKVFIEFQNTSEVAGMKKLRFSPDVIHAQITDESGTPLKTADSPYDGTSPAWMPLLLPFEGTLKFRISFPGLGYKPGRDRTIVDFGPAACWIIPDDRGYFLSGELAIPAQEGDHPYLDWHGTLTLPKIPIPTK